MSITPTLPPLPGRRRLLQGGAALATGHPLLRALAQQPPAGGEPPRLALLIGNRDYPEGEDLPPIHKNVRDLRAVLEKRGFTVDDGLDLDLAQSRAAVQAFAAKVRAAPADCTALFYFSGHGAQVDAENLLVAARANPKARPEVLQRNSLTLSGDVLGPLPNRPGGLTIAVIDACRTSLRDVALGEGLNQVEAPPGKLIAFATGAGRPAIAPADDTRHTFYTASLVKLLERASDEISFSDLFRLVKYDVQNTMLNHPVALLRRFAQFPFIAENTQLRRRLAPLPPPEVAAAAPPPPPRPRDEAEDFARLEAAIWPAEVARLADDYLKNHAASPLSGSAIVAREGAREAVKALRSRDVQLFRSAFVPSADGGGSGLDELSKAGRGDKDAAARIARRLGRGERGRYEGWLQYASELGNGIAAYELALHYRREAQPLLADRYEKRALDLGYTPPPSLDNTRK
ncbi:MAG: caspase domain-containing protein [Betaproteobacteria bacterium]